MRTLALFVWLAACSGGSGGIAPTIVFADRSDAEINRLIGAATGADMFLAEGAVQYYAKSPQSDFCRQVSIAGDTVSITGGCQTPTGELYGTATITNPGSWDGVEYKPSEPTVCDLNGFTTIDGDFRQGFDGLITITDMFTTSDCDVTGDRDGIVVRSKLRIACNSDRSSCATSGGVELPGAGGATVSSPVHDNAPGASSEYTLRGVDTLTASFSTFCNGWHIVGTDRGVTCP